MWALTNGSTTVLEVFRAPRSFVRFIPNPRYGVEVPELAQDATPEAAADHLLLELRAENEPEFLAVQEGSGVFTSWTEAQRRAINILPIIQAPAPDANEVVVTGSSLTVDGTNGVVNETWTTSVRSKEETLSHKGVLARDLLARVASAFQRQLAEGFDYMGRKVQLRDEDRANITAVAAQAKFAILNLGTFPGVDWTCADNSKLHLDADGMSQLADDAFTVFQVWQARARSQKDAIEAMVADEAMTISQLRAYDVEGAW